MSEGATPAAPAAAAAPATGPVQATWLSALSASVLQPLRALRIRYVPDRRCVELKSLKLYLWSFRGEGHFHEAVTNRILDDLVALLAPRSMTVEGDFHVRGGIKTVVEASHGA